MPERADRVQRRVILSAEQLAAWHEMAEAKDVPDQVYVRQALQEKIERDGGQWPDEEFKRGGYRPRVK